MDATAERLLAARAAAPAWLGEWRDAASRDWLSAPLPGRRQETWKYTDLAPLRDWIVAPQISTGKPAAASAAMAIEGLQGPRLVFIDGRFDPEHSDTRTLSGLRLARFSELTEQEQARLRTDLGSAVDSNRHRFSVLNAASISEGVLVDVDGILQPEQAIHLVWWSTAAVAASTARVYVRLGTNSSASVIEHFLSTGAGFAHSTTELVLGDGAQLAHYRLHLEDESALHIGGVHASLSRDSTLRSFHLGLGGTLKRVDANVRFDGQGAQCTLNGAYLLRNRQHSDYQINIEHAVPHCSSDTVFRGIIGDAAKAIFNGRIHIHPGAQRTLAELSNRNLLTSRDAEVNTKPELEIYADDVKCAHGATVAQLDAGMLHYLQSRGISADEAQVMLSFGFVSEVFSSVDCEPLQAFLRPLLGRFFARDPALLRHIA